jgi:hypothetical protein
VDSKTPRYCNGGEDRDGKNYMDGALVGLIFGRRLTTMGKHNGETFDDSPLQ